MNFVSYSFAILFAVAFLARLVVGRDKRGTAYLWILLLLSLIFYSWHVPAYLAIILVTSSIDYVAGRLLGAVRSQRARRLILGVSLVGNLGILFAFKYTNFLLGGIRDTLGLVGVTAALPVVAWGLPMGISFYTFQSMSYTIDVYRGQLEPLRSLPRFLFFVSFFPQLVAGPIVRAADFLYQIPRRRKLRAAVLLEGAWLIIQGYFLKMVIADQAGKVVDAHWAAAAAPDASAALAVVVAALFSIQIFSDFAGYSQIARGLAYVLGYRLIVNFRSPYIARTFSEFWTRWHISLSQWLRDYLYIPLGGNRRGKRRTLVNLMLVMLLGGLWHGAAATFVLWGALHGTALVVERVLGLADVERRRNVWLEMAWFVAVQVVVLAGWVLFRSSSVAQAGAILANIGNLRGGGMGEFPFWTCALLALPVVAMHARTLLIERYSIPPPGVRERAVLAAVMAYAILTCAGAPNAFIYFQF